MFKEIKLLLILELVMNNFLVLFVYLDVGKKSKISMEFLRRMTQKISLSVSNKTIWKTFFEDVSIFQLPRSAIDASEEFGWGRSYSSSEKKVHTSSFLPPTAVLMRRNDERKCHRHQSMWVWREKLSALLSNTNSFRAATWSSWEGDEV